MSLLKTVERGDVVEAIQTSAKIHAINTSAKSNSFPLRPSSALKSKRELYYGLINYYSPGTIITNPIEGRNTMLLALGHSIERHFVEFIERAYAIPYRNLRMNYGELKGPNNEPIPLTGELDFVLQDSKTGELIIADSKSSADFPFKSGIPKDEHIAQINLYMHSSWARERNINRALIMYYNKNNSELKVFEFSYSKQLAEEIIQKFQDVLNAYHKKEIPNREHVYGVHWQAAYSSFKDYDNKEFLIPVSERAKSKIKEFDIEELDRKELVEYLGIRPDASNVFLVDGKRKLWLELGATGLLLKEEKIK